MLTQLAAHLTEVERVALDTVLFIYAFERHPQYGARAQVIFQALEEGRCQGVASVLALGEILAGIQKVSHSAEPCIVFTRGHGCSLR